MKFCSQLLKMRGELLAEAPRFPEAALQQCAWGKGTLKPYMVAVVGWVGFIGYYRVL